MDQMGSYIGFGKVRGSGAPHRHDQFLLCVSCGCARRVVGDSVKVCPCSLLFCVMMFVQMQIYSWGVKWTPVILWQCRPWLVHDRPRIAWLSHVMCVFPGGLCRLACSCPQDNYLHFDSSHSQLLRTNKECALSVKLRYLGLWGSPETF